MLTLTNVISISAFPLVFSTSSPHFCSSLDIISYQILDYHILDYMNKRLRLNISSLLNWCVHTSEEVGWVSQALMHQ